MNFEKAHQEIKRFFDEHNVVPLSAEEAIGYSDPQAEFWMGLHDFFHCLLLPKCVWGGRLSRVPIEDLITQALIVQNRENERGCLNNYEERKVAAAQWRFHQALDYRVAKWQVGTAEQMVEIVDEIRVIEAVEKAREITGV